MALYYISENGVRRGPFEVGQLAGEGLRADSLVWCEGMDSWQRADAVAELAAAFPSMAASAPPGQQYSPGYENPTTQYYSSDSYYYQQPKRGLGIGIASMVLGIVSVCIFCIWFLSIPCALIAIIMGFVAVKEPGGRPFGIAGIICGFVSVGILAVIFILAMAFRYH